MAADQAPAKAKTEKNECGGREGLEECRFGSMHTRFWTPCVLGVAQFFLDVAGCFDSPCIVNLMLVIKLNLPNLQQHRRFQYLLCSHALICLSVFVREGRPSLDAEGRSPSMGIEHMDR